MNDVTRILAAAEIYGIASYAFKYPDDEMLDYMSEAVGEIAEAMQVTNADPGTMDKGLAFAAAAVARDAKAVRHDYNEFFTGRKQTSLDESEHDTAIFYRHQRIADISGFYNAFGFEVSQQEHQRPDFIGTELEFMCMLLLKRTYALEQSWNDEAEVCLDAERKFFTEHLEWWMPQLCETIRGASSCAFYISLSNFLESFIRNEALRYLQPA